MAAVWFFASAFVCLFIHLFVWLEFVQWQCLSFCLYSDFDISVYLWFISNLKSQKNIQFTWLLFCMPKFSWHQQQQMAVRTERSRIVKTYLLNTHKGNFYWFFCYCPLSLSSASNCIWVWNEWWKRVECWLLKFFPNCERNYVCFALTFAMQFWAYFLNLFVFRFIFMTMFWYWFLFKLHVNLAFAITTPTTKFTWCIDCTHARISFLSF